MGTLKRHWLGIAVLLSLGFAWYGMATAPRNLVGVFCLPFTFLVFVWVVRGFIRMAGRAWRHSAVKGR